MAPERFAELLRAMHKRRITVHVHCNGDEAVDLFLDTFEAILWDDPWFDQAQNVFLHAKVTASPYSEKNVPEYAVDGNHHNRRRYYAAGSTPAHLTIELEKPMKLNTIRLWTNWYWGIVLRYCVEGSVDGKTWTMLADQRHNTETATARGRVFHFPLQQIRFVRVRFPGGSQGATSRASITEIQGYALDAELVRQLDKWKDIKSGLHGSFGSIDQRYKRHCIPETSSAMTFSGTAWRGERLSAQIILWTSDGAQQVRCYTTPLRRKDGRQLPASSVSTAFVRYVTGGPKLMADVLDTTKRLDLNAHSARPIWVSLDIPRDASPGLYQGRVNVQAEGGISLPFEFSVKVLPATLPTACHWSFHLDLWQNPWSVARYHHVKPWSAEHWLLLEPLLKMLADAGQKCVGWMSLESGIDLTECFQLLFWEITHIGQNRVLGRHTMSFAEYKNIPLSPRRVFRIGEYGHNIFFFQGFK